MFIDDFLVKSHYVCEIINMRWRKFQIISELLAFILLICECITKTTDNT